MNKKDNPVVGNLEYRTKIPNWWIRLRIVVRAIVFGEIWISQELRKSSYEKFISQL